MNTLEQSIEKYQYAIKLTGFFSRRALSIIRKIFFVGLVLSTIGGLVALYFFSGLYSQTLFGLAFLFLMLWMEQILLFSYHNSYYFRGLNSIIGLEEEDTGGATYDVADIIFKHKDDTARAFCVSDFGSISLIRSGIAPQIVDDFLKSNRTKLSADQIMLPEDEIFSIIGLGKYLLKHDPNFKEMVRVSGIQEDSFLGALRWVVGSYHQEKRRERWWSKDNLSKTTGVGREWTYGTAFLLERYSRDIRTSAVFSTLSADSSFANEKIIEIETALSKAQSSNVLIIGEPGVGKIDLIMKVAERMRLGKSLNSVSSKNIIVLDTNKLFSTHNNKQDLEFTILEMFDQASEAGNCIIVIENLSSFVRDAEGLGTFIPDLIDQHLSIPNLQIIATDTPNGYHTYLETLGSFARRFSEILIDSPDRSATTRLLQNVAMVNEFKFKILFTYSALEAITISADRFVVEGVMPDKAINLLVEIAAKASSADTGIINDDFVYTYISETVGVPAGPIKDSERDLLLNLEDRLHQQVVGQNNAVGAIARTMRRARAGIQSSEKPIGSFLFLGPTGVGKTETAKALAKVFFGDEDKMQRLDMSEFGGIDALEKLIGDGEQSGALPAMLREHPYSVLLLDEFEKATQSIHDIFLQVLDEGVFTDSRGMKVNARNTIIIATSNAGSQLILRTVQQRKDLGHLSQEIIDHIVRDGIYRPELINRFDSTIIFEPLSMEQQTQVASLMLGGLYERVKGKGYEIKVDDELLGILVEKGYHPEFGARPMQRILQNVIEEKVAQKIISGSVQKGGSIALSKEDFTEDELNVQGT